MFEFTPPCAFPTEFAHRVRLAWQSADEPLEARPRQPRIGEVEHVDAVVAEQIGFDGLRMFIEEPEEANYSGIVASNPPSMIDPRSR